MTSQSAAAASRTETAANETLRTHPHCTSNSGVSSSDGGDHLQWFLGKLRGVKPAGRGQWMAQCPLHDDRHASLSVGLGRDGRVLLRCHVGCSFDAILGAMNLTARDLFPHESRRGTNERASAPRRESAAVFEYRDEGGEPLCRVLRYEAPIPGQAKPDKRFSQERWEANRWVPGVAGVRRVPFMLPELLSDVSAGKLILVPEGEKHVQALRALGFASTCASGGAGGSSQWTPAFAEPLRGADVLLLPDNDQPGRQLADKIGAVLQGLARSVRALDLPGLPDKGDVLDWLAAGGTAVRLREMFASAPGWSPSTVAPPSNEITEALGRALAGLPVDIGSDGLPGLRAGASDADMVKVIRSVQRLGSLSTATICMTLGKLASGLPAEHGALKLWCQWAFPGEGAAYQRLRDAHWIYRAWSGIWRPDAQLSLRQLKAGASAAFTPADRERIASEHWPLSRIEDETAVRKPASLVRIEVRIREAAKRIRKLQDAGNMGPAAADALLLAALNLLESGLAAADATTTDLSSRIKSHVDGSTDSLQQTTDDLSYMHDKWPEREPDEDRSVHDDPDDDRDPFWGDDDPYGGTEPGDPDPFAEPDDPAATGDDVLPSTPGSYRGDDPNFEDLTARAAAGTLPKFAEDPAAKSGPIVLQTNARGEPFITAWDLNFVVGAAAARHDTKTLRQAEAWYADHERGAGEHLNGFDIFGGDEQADYGGIFGDEEPAREQSRDFPSTSPDESCAGLTLAISDEQIQRAFDIGGQRTAGHEGRRSPEQEHGSAANAAVDFAGALAEIVVVDALKAAGVSVSDWEPVARRAVSRPDLVIDGVPVEIKAVTGQYATVNSEQARKFSSVPNLRYLIVRRFSEYEAWLYGPIEPGDVAEWALRESGSSRNATSAYRSCPVAKLPRLVDLAQLVAPPPRSTGKGLSARLFGTSEPPAAVAGGAPC